MNKATRGWKILTASFTLVCGILAILYGIGLWLKPDLAKEPSENDKWQAYEDGKLPRGFSR